tara:strand:+ start:136 stop:1362 length:1227 start_codon:yes stop_codon:yes gene_type:complete
MKKLTFILLILISFTNAEMIAQVASGGTSNRSVFKNIGAADRINTSSVFGEIGDWSTDLTISEKTPSEAAALWPGPFHIGMGSTGWGSFTAGAYNRASGNGAFVGGFHNVAGPTDSDTNSINGGSIGQTAFGFGTQATGNASFSSGQETIASGNHSTAMGLENKAWGSTNFTVGYQNVAGNQSDGSGGSATAMGKYNSASADASMALNRGTSATNQASTSMGFRTISDNLGMLAIGVNNAAGIGDPTPSQYYYANGVLTGAPAGVAFVIGNGDINTLASQRGDNPSNAFKVMFNGDTSVSNNLTVSGDIVVSSDARLKANIVSLGSTLARLLLIDGKTYTMKKDGKQKIGVLAQDIQKVFPELVSEDDNEMLAVNYQGLVPVLINALKEQDDKISRLEVLVEKLMSDK